MAAYSLGQLVRITATFTDENGDAADPGAVFCQIKTPAGVTTSYEYGVDGEVVKDSTGVFHLDLDCDAVGWWSWRWYSTTSVQAADEDRLQVSESEFD